MGMKSVVTVKMEWRAWAEDICSREESRTLVNSGVAYLCKSYQLSLGQDHCTDVCFLWGLCHHQSVGHDILHPEAGDKFLKVKP
jgi:hypothetical protein